jgi:hypothetical protein
MIPTLKWSPDCAYRVSGSLILTEPKAPAGTVWTTEAVDYVDLYSVGVLADLRSSWRYLSTHREDLLTERIHRVRTVLGYSLRRTLTSIRTRRWSYLRNSLNGYLAEITNPSTELARKVGAGHGWTRTRALRSLQRQLEAKQAVLWAEAHS